MVGFAANISAMLSILLQPYMPETCEKLQAQMNIHCNQIPESGKFCCILKAGHQIGKVSIWCFQTFSLKIYLYNSHCHFLRNLTRKILKVIVKNLRAKMKLAIQHMDSYYIADVFARWQYCLIKIISLKLLHNVSASSLAREIKDSIDGIDYSVHFESQQKPFESV